MSTTPLAVWMSIGPMSSGANTPRPPPSIIAGPPMPMLVPLVQIRISLTPAKEAFPVKQHLERAAPSMGGDGEGAALQEGAWVDLAVDVLPGGALIAASATGHGLRPGLVPGEPPAVGHLGEVGTDGVEVDYLLAVVGSVLDVLWRDEDQRLVLLHDLAERGRNGRDAAARLGRDHVFHLHRLEDGQDLADANQIALLHRNLADRGLKRRPNGLGSLHRRVSPAADC